MSLNVVTSKGIFHGLPTFPEHDDRGYTAIVAGASGISGAYIIRALAETPSRWAKIYAISRRAPTGKLPANVEHVSVDLLDEPDRVAEKLRAKVVKS
jgi:nucleoside-diphosphate-sugar epimerase